jgi:N-acetylated-alpha-linked acidic dipeptidase
MRETTRINNEVLKGNYLELAADTARPFFPPKPTKEVPYIDFSPLLNAISMLEKSVEHAHAVWVQARITGGNHEALNQLLYHAEQQLLLENGLPGRPWYKHALYAPGFYTGYGVKTMPSIREAIEQRNFKQAEEQIKVVAVSIIKLSNYLSAL